MKQRRLQGGSLGGFIIVAVLLGLVLLGGLYGLQRYNSAERPQVAGGQEDKRQDQGEREKTPAEETTAGDKQTGSSDWNESEDQTPAEEEAPAATDERDADSLPATGPADSLPTALALAGVAYMATAGIRSRHWTSREK